MRTISIVTFLIILFIQNSFTQDDNLTRLLRFPDIHKNKIAFVYAGDIWVVDSEGGTARQLTSYKGIEIFPKFSPDGEWIAFSGEYSGNRQVYVISVNGGMPKQLTYYNDVGIMPPRGGLITAFWIGLLMEKIYYLEGTVFPGENEWVSILQYLSTVVWKFHFKFRKEEVVCFLLMEQKWFTLQSIGNGERGKDTAVVERRMFGYTIL
jgi:hypothetical protein